MITGKSGETGMPLGVLVTPVLILTPAGHPVYMREREREREREFAGVTQLHQHVVTTLFAAFDDKMSVCMSSMSGRMCSKGGSSHFSGLRGGIVNQCFRAYF